MQTRQLLLGAVAAVSAASFLPSASAIVVIDDVGPAGSRAFADPFDSVVSLGGCTGVLIAPDVVLTARHCNIFAGDVARFGENENAPDFVVSVQSVFNPAGGGSLLDGGDLTLARLSSPVPANIATPMQLTDETTSLLGETAATIGYGLNGVGSTGHQFSSDGRRWGGTNVIDRYGSPANTGFGANIWSTDFDNRAGTSNTIAGSSNIATEFEATTAPGDSGGPLFVEINDEWVVAGILSGGTFFDSSYGDTSWWTGVSPFRSQIESFGGNFIVVPEPAALTVFAGAGLLALRRRR